MIVSGVEADMWPKYHQRIKAAFGENVEDLDVEVEAGKSFLINHNFCSIYIERRTQKIL